MSEHSDRNHPYSFDRAADDIGRAFEHLAQTQPSALAMHVPGRATLRYASLGAQVRYVRERLADWGIGRGDIVVALISSRPEMALACASIPSAATLAPLSAGLSVDRYAELLARMRPKALIAQKAVDHPVRLAAQRCRIAEIDLVADAAAAAGTFTLELGRRQEPLEREASGIPDWAYLLTTSGTTGQAKLVPVSHRRVALIAQHQGDWLQMTTDDIACHLVPMHSSLGLSSALLIPLLRGASVLCLPESDIGSFFVALDEYPVTYLPATFTHHRAILKRAREFPAAVARSRLRVLRAAGPIEQYEIDQIEEIFRAPLLRGYSMTEAYSITHEPLPPRTRKRGSVGLPVCNQVAIMAESGEMCATGTTGEVVVRGPMVFEGYFDDPQATSRAFVDGWFRTGDLGRFDEDGFLFLVGRIKDVINRGGEKISPVELDAVIEAIPGVDAAATFAVPHPTLGEEVVAAVVRRGDVAVEASDITEEVRRRMGPNGVPRHVYFVDELPRTETGKVRRAELPRLLALDPRNAAACRESAREGPLAGIPLKAKLMALWSAVLRPLRRL